MWHWLHFQYLSVYFFFNFSLHLIRDDFFHFHIFFSFRLTRFGKKFPTLLLQLSQNQWQCGTLPILAWLLIINTVINYGPPAWWTFSFSGDLPSYILCDYYEFFDLWQINWWWWWWWWLCMHQSSLMFTHLAWNHLSQLISQANQLSPDTLLHTAHLLSINSALIIFPFLRHDNKTRYLYFYLDFILLFLL